MLRCVLVACFLLASACFSGSLRAQTTRPAPDRARADRAAWMRKARFGVMNHYLEDWIAQREQVPHGRFTARQWNDMVDKIDVNALAEQVRSVGARYQVFTIGQNSGFYVSPNAMYDRIVGIQPSHCSKRDLIAELGDALHRRGLKFIVYLPSGAPAQDRVACQKLQWQNGPHRNEQFQKNWESIIREWSTRWGTRVDGWWFDGCYWPNTMYRSKSPPNFESFATAARAGNLDSAVAFNPGVIYRTISVSPEEDYIAGEVNLPDRWSPHKIEHGLTDGVQVQMLSYLGEHWGKGDKPRLTDKQAISYSRQLWKSEGSVTWDVPITTEGRLHPAFVEQLTAIGKAADSH